MTPNQTPSHLSAAQLGYYLTLWPRSPEHGPVGVQGLRTGDRRHRSARSQGRHGGRGSFFAQASISGRHSHGIPAFSGSAAPKDDNVDIYDRKS